MITPARAADLLWPHEQDKAMAAFMEAFDLAVQNLKEHGDQIARADLLERNRPSLSCRLTHISFTAGDASLVGRSFNLACDGLCDSFVED